MPFVISILNQKGGVGKTTISINLARAYQIMGYSVTLLDGSYQGSASHWSVQSQCEKLENNAIKYFDLRYVNNRQIHESIHESSSEIIIIDGDTADLEMNISAIKASNLIVIPITPSIMDCWTTYNFVELINKIQKKQKICLLINNIDEFTQSGQEFPDLIKQFELPVLDTRIPSSINYVNAIVNGRTIFEETEFSQKNYRKSFDLAWEIKDKYIPNELIKNQVFRNFLSNSSMLKTPF